MPDATADNQIWGFWRELVFLLGTLALAAALLFVGHTSEGAERWMCLVGLAIILYSVYCRGGLIGP